MLCVCVSTHIFDETEILELLLCLHRLIDGTDLMPLLTKKDNSSVPHEFLFHYCGTSMHAARWTPMDGALVLETLLVRF